MLKYKIILLGSGGVGKSALTQRFIHGSFSEGYDPTIEDCYQKNIEVNNETCQLEILDTAGTEQFSSMRDVYIKSGDAFVIVYSINSISTFNDIQPIIDQITTIKDSDPAPLIIVGNKCDLDDDREVTEDLGQLLAKNSHCSFIEASAKLDLNVNEIFYDLLRQLANKRKSVQSINSDRYETFNQVPSSYARRSAVVSPVESIPMQKAPSNISTDPPKKPQKKGLCDKCQEACIIL
ncbi:unnamed protein product [Brachionus calyciflorus]|uniref:Uncharacterized protein n=1 Tax=Brachionus calyciflorus TaxID=104777 RepID=A0A814PB69_9BILA|nr:unnamed protein product [Brachionus calyciflorus]